MACPGSQTKPKRPLNRTPGSQRAVSDPLQTLVLRRAGVRSRVDSGHSRRRKPSSMGPRKVISCLDRRESTEGGLSAPMADHGTSDRQGRVGPIISHTTQHVPRLTMTRHLKAIYEGGVFRPLEPVEIAEHQEVSLPVEMPDEQPPDAEADMPIWEYAAQLMRDIPEDQLKALPADGASQHDHYLDRAPKRPRCAASSPTPSIGSRCSTRATRRTPARSP